MESKPPKGLVWYSDYKDWRQKKFVVKPPVTYSIINSVKTTFKIRVSIRIDVLNEIGWKDVGSVDGAYEAGHLYLRKRENGKKLSKAEGGEVKMVFFATSRLKGWPKAYDRIIRSTRVVDAWHNEETDTIIIKLWETENE